MSSDDFEEVDLDLSKGDYVYQSDQELFLVVTAVNDGSYEFAVHGWREISDYRLQEYLDGDTGKLHRQDQVERVVADSDQEDVKENFGELQELFKMYRGGLPEEGPHTEFKLEDTEDE
jgi:hypothetical protein